MSATNRKERLDCKEYPNPTSSWIYPRLLKLGTRGASTAALWFRFITSKVGHVTHASPKQLRTGCGVWLFDLVRPMSNRLVEQIPISYECVSGVQLSSPFKTDWMHSLRAGWLFEELSNSVLTTGLKLASSEADMSQVHWVPPNSVADHTSIPKWTGGALKSADENRFLRICRAFKTVSCFENSYDGK